MKLKCRIWDNDKKIMYYPKDLHNYFDIVISSDEKGNQHILLHCNYNQYIPPINFILEQFTGLTDKNGKEIYEGDIMSDDSGDKYILRFGLQNIDDNEEYDDNIVCGFYLEYIGKKRLKKYYHLGFLTQLEVIGNKYDNSELLEVNKWIAYRK